MREYQRIVSKEIEHLATLQESYDKETPEHQAYEDMIQAIVDTCWK